MGTRLAVQRAQLLESAAKFLQIGARVFPCGPDKRPLTKTGFKAATDDFKVIERWLAKCTDAMLAVATGKVSGIFVVDLDYDALKGVDGMRWLAEIQQQCGQLPPHAVARTPRGGKHLYFKYPAGLTIKCSASLIAPGVDVRGDGGYVIVPPSISSVGEYTWEVSPWEVLHVD